MIELKRAEASNDRSIVIWGAERLSMPSWGHACRVAEAINAGPELWEAIKKCLSDRGVLAAWYDLAKVADRYSVSPPLDPDEEAWMEYENHGLNETADSEDVFKAGRRSLRREMEGGK